MSNEHINKDDLTVIERFPVDRRQAVAKAMGIKYSIPTPAEQIEGKGFLSMYKKTNAKKEQLAITLPEIIGEEGKIVSAIHINPLYARFYIKELIRICDTEGL